MSSIDSEDENLLWNEILARRRRTRLIGVIATIGLTAGAAIWGGVATGAWLPILGFFAVITVGTVMVNGISDATDRGEPIRLLRAFLVLVSLGVMGYLLFSGRLVEMLTLVPGPID
ncbi:hypothetical protein [Rhodococcus sp. 3-2]|uniref:hypothetical protein n=1 Tax=Rhodococcus sp. 3-2 TaxID=2890836 RepID=UPI001D1858B0|nr:hypothetical protein [Rhodococcus sp. 3-2]MCC4306671.1 hypothetical protein [Rhodococcus sp. 3-2]